MSDEPVLVLVEGGEKYGWPGEFLGRDSSVIIGVPLEKSLHEGRG